jgi:hypothetical protein
VLGAIGTGRAYVVRGTFLAELQYNNETESPEALAKSSETILSALGKSIGDKLPSLLSEVPGLQTLPKEERIASGVTYFPRDAFGISNLGSASLGYYKGAKKRYRIAVLGRDSEEQAKDSLKVLRGKPSGKPYPGLFDDAVSVDVGGSKESPKIEWVFARKGNTIVGAGSEEYAMKDKAPEKIAEATMKREELAEVIKKVMAKPAAPAPTAKPTK